jgi:16S rRNA (guanine527-N7)-methyltransferase
MKSPDPALLQALEPEFGLPPGSGDRIGALLRALAEEPDPHTTVFEPSAALEIHVRDSLVALELDQVRAAATIADLGAGAGFPGLPLAIALPQTRVDLVESAGRKCAVIDRLAKASGVRNARSLDTRAEELASTDARATYDLVTARAVAPLGVLLEYAAPLLRLGGSFVAWKGIPEAAELDGAAAAASQLHLEPTSIVPVTPFPASENRHLYVYSKVAETPDRFPRRPGMALKRPLVAEKPREPT